MLRKLPPDLSPVVPDATLRNSAEAIALATKAAAILPDGDVLDTLACAYESAGDTTKAIAEENLAEQSGWTPQYSDVSSDKAKFVAAPPRPCTDPNLAIDTNKFREK
jgi:hypothetical protein